MSERYVLAAVDGSEDRDRALRFGIAEARRHRLPLRLVHVPADPPPLLALGAMVPVYDTAVMDETANAILDATLARARELAGPDLAVDGVVQHGARTQGILDTAADAAVVVLATRSSKWRRLITGSTTAGVAGRCQVPVVCVPARWDDTTEHGRIIAAIDGSPATESILQVGVAEAERRDTTLTVLHAWQPHPAYADVIEAQRRSGAWQHDSERMLSELTAGIRGDHPDVHVELVGLFEPTAETMVEQSATADLMLVGRRGQSSPFGLSIGSITRVMITHAACPVMVVPPSEE